jgi:hypothetical protein
MFALNTLDRKMQKPNSRAALLAQVAWDGRQTLSLGHLPPIAMGTAKLGRTVFQKESPGPMEVPEGICV